MTSIGAIAAVTLLLQLSQKPVTVISKECGVQVVSPHPLEHRTFPAPQSTGTVHAYFGEAEDVVYELTCIVDLTIDALTADQLLQATQSGRTGRNPANLISQQAITLDGKPGRELRTRVGVGQMRSRTFVLRGRVVTVSIVGGESRVLSSEATAFLGSLRSTRERLR